MRTVKVIESVDIRAPKNEVFNVIVNCDRRLQLSPLWGTTEVKLVSPDFPQEGSGYVMKLRQGDEEYTTTVTDFVPGRKFAYHLNTDRKTSVTWLFQEVTQGTRLIYREEFLVEEDGDEEFVRSVRQVVQQWLNNIKRYTELDDSRLQRLLKWVLDRYVLRLRADQRRVIMMLLALQGMSILSFAAVVIGWGIISLVM